MAEVWKEAILAAQSQNAVNVDVWDRIFPKPLGGVFDVVPHALGIAFIEDGSGEAPVPQERPTASKQK